MRSLTLTLAITLPVAACAGAGGAPEPEPVARRAGWQAGVAPHVALWYHSLALVGGTAALGETAAAPLPFYQPGYADTVEAAKRRRGVAATPLDRRADELRQALARDNAYIALEFVPLYFRDADALFGAVRVWQQAQGDPRRMGTEQGARVVALLSGWFPREVQRRVVGEWTELVREEGRLFYDRYWQERTAALAQLAAAVQREWDALAPALASLLDYLQLESGELLLVPALGAEGRTVSRGLELARVAVGAPPDSAPAHALWSFLHELLYALVGDVIREHVAPARIRELGESVLEARAAVRGGAMLLERQAPERVPEYQRFFLVRAGRAAPAGAGARAAAFAEAFPLPDELERGLADALGRALAGI